MNAYKTEAIAQADAFTNNAGLPTYSELLQKLKAIANLYPEQCAQRADEVHGVNDGKSRGILLQAALDISRAAIAKVEGE